jgi:L-seryl-tRNA(Ser) seleniumtransferase
VTNPYRSLPSVDSLLADRRVMALAEAHGREAITNLAREVLDAQRDEIGRGNGAIEDTVDLLVARTSSLEPTLVRVINATGVIIHTNLGRAPLARSAIDAMQRVTQSYSTLEFDIAEGTRGSRHTHLEPLLCSVTGAEAALVVNNGASALLLALAALCADREVPISRGQLVEIGGGFRIPDVMRQSGAHLVEVGTTNRTYARDYEAAITEETAALLRVHSSNFAVIGFTATATIAELAELAAKHKIALIDDVGSGALLDTQQYGLAAEPTVQESVEAGADVVLFSGDKLVGGPQAGIVVGKREAIESMRQHPLARAVRIDKASIAALAATLKHYAVGDAETEIPVWRMIAEPVEQLSHRARRWARTCPAHGETLEERSTVGGGSLPGEELPTVVCAITPPDGDADAFAAQLRARPTPIVARIKDGRVLLDPRTVDPREDGHVEQALATICGSHQARPRPLSRNGN